METKRQYSTRQKSLILNFFETHKSECFTAKQLIENSSFHIGEATIYRLLTKLSNEGKLRTFLSDKRLGATYQYNNTERCESHFHLKCMNCGKTVCMDCSFMREMENHIESEHEFSLDNTKTVLYGICKNCN